MLPAICQKIMDQSQRWYMPSYPVVPWSYFFDRVKDIARKQIKEIDKLIEEETVQSAAAYLHDMGEVSDVLRILESQTVLMYYTPTYLCLSKFHAIMPGLSEPERV